MNSNPTPNWYSSLATVASLGSQADRPGSLAGLAAARREHLSQFFTPEAVTQYIWALVSPAIDRISDLGYCVSILDNSVGTGRMLRYADPSKHALYGIDVHRESIDALAETAEAAGFSGQFVCCPMEEAHPRHFHLALLNPPFSISLSSPSMEPYDCTHWGKFGPNTSAVSHAYAVEQALEAASIVVAVLPTSYAEELASNPSMRRLCAIIKLPRGVFREEGTDVAVSLAVFESAHRSCQSISVNSLDEPPPALNLFCEHKRSASRIGRIGVEPTDPVITLPVTGNSIVRIVHDGRWIRLKFSCGLVQAKVMNAIFRARVDPPSELEIRHPKGTRYKGQGVLDLEVHLAQPDPQASFSALLALITETGGLPKVDLGLSQFFARRIRETLRGILPFRHTVFVQAGAAVASGEIIGKAKNRHLVDKKVWGAPVIAAGQEIIFQSTVPGFFQFHLQNKDYTLTSDELAQRFEVTSGRATAGWKTIHEGVQVAYPQQANTLMRRAQRLGIDQWLSWDYQLEDAIELVLKGSGVAAWTMGLGKARLAAALVLLSECKHGLICVESQLIPEMIRELSGLPIPVTDWQVISKASNLDNLRRINIISYERLRRSADREQPNVSYAKRLRRRIGVLVADEGHLLANAESLQSRALWNLSAKHRYILTGTPSPNYPRDIHPLLAFTGGDGTAAQPWGYRRGFLEQNWRHSMNHARRGIDAFREKFIVVEWSTNEFKEDNRNGAKREIPRLGNVPAYREAIAPFVKRRVTEEPDVTRYVRIPTPTKIVTDIEWDEAHLSYYLTVCEQFAEWYKKAHVGEGKRINLITLLARIQAVVFAANYPQKDSQYRPSYFQRTSKQRYAVERLAELANEGHKTIFYADSPGLLTLIEQDLRRLHGIDSVLFHGERPIKTRTADLDEQFRFGPCPTLLASIGVTQTGLNIHAADRVVFFNRAWSAKTESQALARVLRPQQQRDVVAEYLHLPGSIDAYMAQMVYMKQDAQNAGLDWATPETEDLDFLHVDTIIGRFAEQFAKDLGVHRFDLRKHLAGGMYTCLHAT